MTSRSSFINGKQVGLSFEHDRLKMSNEDSTPNGYLLSTGAEKGGEIHSKSFWRSKTMCRFAW